MDNLRDEKAMRRHQRFWNFVRPICSLVMRLLYGYTSELTKVPEGAYLIACNHTTNIDPIFLGVGFNKNMYFVAGDQVFRMGWLTRFLNRYFAPICRVKGTTDAASAMTIMRTLKNGSNVAMFAEGNRSFNGKNLPIIPATGKLVRSSGAGLITYRIDGGYMTHPRWGATMRHGRMHGHLVHIYTAEEIKAMTPKEINDVINRDIAYDDYAYQRRSRIAYRSNKRAENLELALYICPKCGEKDKLHSKGADFWCECGFKTKLDVFGCFIEGPFTDPGAWDEWQNGEIEKIADNTKEEVIYADRGAELCRRSSADELEVVGTGNICMYRDRMEINGERFELAKVNNMAMEMRKILVFEYEGIQYLVNTTRLFGLRKYLQMYELLKNRR